MKAKPSILEARTLHRRAHLRLLFAGVAGAGVGLLMNRADIVTRGLIGWDAGVAILLLGIWRMMATTSLAQLRLKAAQQDETAPTILGLMTVAVAASLFGVLAEMNHGQAPAGYGATLSIVLALVTLALSWICMHMLFAIHYAHRYYGDRTDAGTASPGLIFPERDPAPGYMEFVYFSFCLGMTYQVSDVMTATRAFRRLITLHGVLSFFYNTFVLALAVSLLSAGSRAP